MTYGDLRMIRAEFEELMQLSLAAGTIKHPVPYEKYVDEQFARNAQAGHHSAMRKGHATTARSWRRLLAAGVAGGVAVTGRRRGCPAFKAGVFDPPRLAPDFSLQGSNGRS